MLRRITYTVGWLTMVVPTQVRGCANVGSLTALDVPAQSERRSAKIEASPQMDSLVRSETQTDRMSASLTTPERQPTDGLATAHSTEEAGEASKRDCTEGCTKAHEAEPALVHTLQTFGPAAVSGRHDPARGISTSERGSPDGGRKRSSSAANSEFTGSLRTWSTQRGISDTAGHAFSCSQPSAAPLQEQATATLAATADWPSNLQSTCHSDVDNSTSELRQCGARATSICDSIASFAKPSTALQPCTGSEGESHEAVRVTTARSSDGARVSPARRDAEFKFKPGERNPRNDHYHCGYCAFSWSNALGVCNHWVAKHGMSRGEAARVMTARNPGIAVDAPVRRGAQSTFKPGERNPRNNYYHCGHCGFSWSNALTVCDHWVEKHGMARDEAASVMTAQNPDLSLDRLTRRGHQPEHKPGEYNAKFKVYHCGHCSRQSTSEQVIRKHWMEKHGMSTEEAARVMAAQNPDLSLGKPARRRPQFRFKPGEYNPKFKVYHCGHCSRQSTSERSIRNHWVEKHGMSTEEAASVMRAQNPDLSLDKPARRRPRFKFKPGERNPRNNQYHCGHCRLSWSNALKVCDHWVEQHEMSTDEAARVMTAQNPDLSLDKLARRGPWTKRKPGEYNPKSKRYHCGHCKRQSTSERSILNHWVEKHGMSTEEAARVMTAQNPSPST
jgi:predicted transposase YbfD/YdcC